MQNRPTPLMQRQANTHTRRSDEVWVEGTYMHSSVGRGGYSKMNGYHSPEELTTKAADEMEGRTRKGGGTRPAAIMRALWHAKWREFMMDHRGDRDMHLNDNGNGCGGRSSSCMTCTVP